MIKKMNKFEAIVKARIDEMEASLDYAITIKDETHDLPIVLYFSEEGEDFCLRKLKSYKVGNQSIKFCDKENLDFGDSLFNAILEWLSDNFCSINVNIGDKCEELFTEVWDSLEMENLT